MTLDDRPHRTLADRAGSRRRLAFALAGAIPLVLVTVIVAMSVLNNGRDAQVATGPAAEGRSVPAGAPSPSQASPGAPSPSQASPGTCTVSPSEGPAADEALARFFAARIARDWDAAQPVITPRFASETGGRDGFIGPSSPHVDRFTVFGDVERTPERARICARTYQSTSNERFYADDTLTLLRGGNGQWRVDEWARGPVVEMAASTDSTVWFVVPDAENCGLDRAERVPVVVSVPSGPDANRHTVEELLSGPVGRIAGDKALTLLPLDARIRSLSIEGDLARLDLTDAADAGGGACLQGGRREQALQTLLSLPGVRRAEVTAGGRPADESFQP